MKPSSDGPPAGVERRRHLVYVTLNTEYHVRGGQVVAVRKRGERDFLPAHTALHTEVKGHVEGNALLPVPGPAQPGQRLYLARPGKDVVTSKVLAVERPAKEIVVHYPPEAA